MRTTRRNAQLPTRPADTIFMHLESFGPRRLRLTLASVPLELWLNLDPGHPPRAVWFDGETGELLAEVPVIDAARRAGRPHSDS